MTITDAECAALMLDTFPQVMRSIAHDVREFSGGPATIPQYRVLGYLYHHGLASMGHMAERQGVTLPTMTKIVAGLVERGLVEREADSQDRRIVRLHLTDEGRALFTDIHARMQARLAALVAAMTTDDKAALAAGLRAFRDVLSRAQDGLAHDHCARA